MNRSVKGIQDHDSDSMFHVWDLREGLMCNAFGLCIPFFNTMSRSRSFFEGKSIISGKTDIPHSIG